MSKGGYQIIDLKHNDLRDKISTEYDDIYEKLERTTSPILLTNITVEGVEYPDQFVTRRVVNSNFELTVLFGKPETTQNYERSIVFVIGLTEDGKTSVTPRTYLS